MSISFLKAEWRKLAIANYEVSPEILEKYLPAFTELDSWNGKHYVSLIGFMFLNTKMLGLKIPFHVNFEEVNLRFYVKFKEGDEWKRGVVFVKELVPKKALTIVANTLYKEHYQAVPMSHSWKIDNETIAVEYGWKINQELQTFSLQAENKPMEIPEGSEAEFITEHYWGYTKVTNSKTYEYEVRHPRWKTYPVKNHSIQVDFRKVYGKDFSFLNSQTPISVMLAEGSEISVENKKNISKFH
jgi:uncharacterized protein YqjF (DUF2071 family)